MKKTPARLAALPLLVLTAVGLASAQKYAITSLGFLPSGNYSVPYGINNLGQIVGFATTSSGQDHAFLWTNSGGMQDLGTLGSGQSFAQGINDFRQVVGAAQIISNGSFLNRAFTWTKSGGMQDLGTLGGSQANAYAINGFGQVVGFSVTSNNLTHAFLWTKSGGMQDLGTLGGGQTSLAHGISNLGQIVGTSGNHAFLWANSGGMTDLGTLGGGQSSAGGINDFGQVVGISLTSSGLNHAFLWTKNGGMQDLGTLPGDSYSQAYAINDLGQVVGVSQQGSTERASLWEKKGGMQDLNTLIPANSGWVLIYATGINFWGQITGYGVLNGEGTAFLLTPRLR